MFRNVVRRIGTINCTAENQVLSLDLPRKDFYRQLILRCFLRINISTLGSPVLLANTPSMFIRRIEVVADGKDTIKSITGRALLMKNFFNFGVYPRRTVPTLATGNNDFYLTLVLPFALPRAIREIDTILDSGRLSTFELRITFGQVTGAALTNDLFSTNPTTYTFTSASVDVMVQEAVKFDNKPITPSIYKEMSISRQLTSTQSEFQILLPVGNVYRGFLIEAIADAVVRNDIINEVQIRSGTTVFTKAPWNNLREFNAVLNGMESVVFDGFAYIDFCPEGRLVDGLNTSNLSQLEAVFNATLVGTTDYINIYPEEIIIPTLVRA